MIRKIVVPVDGSAASERIVPHLAELRRAVDAGVNLIHVAGADLVSQIKGRDYLKSLEKRAEGILAFDATALRIGEPAVEILKHAAAERAGLIALTTRGASTLRRVRFGTTAIELLRASRAPLLIVRPEWPVRPFRKILAAIDGAPASRGVLECVADLARGGEAEVALVRVLFKGDEPEKAASSLDRTAALFREKAVRVESRMVPGDPAKSILEEAREQDADLIAIGVFGRRGSDPFFFGSVAESVLLGSTVPVLLFRPGRATRNSRPLARGARE
ncbi:MAG TPA: universal stress protein [Planctomycetota bacterium]|nr:universal stress protein [Planctomycetota bacterium]